MWSWLIGPFLDAWLKVHPGDRPGGATDDLLAGSTTQFYTQGAFDFSFAGKSFAFFFKKLFQHGDFTGSFRSGAFRVRFMMHHWCAFRCVLGERPGKFRGVNRECSIFIPDRT